MCGDARNWDEDAYRESILKEREIQTRTVFRTVWAPSLNPNPNPETIVAASSDGSIASYSISSCISKLQSFRNTKAQHLLVAEPDYFVQGHDGPAYDIKFYGDGEDALLLSCGDDGRIRGWRWKDFTNSDVPITLQAGKQMKPVLDLVNPQHKGPWGSLSPIPENNAIAVNIQGGSIFSASGDSCAYCWDVETGKLKVVFKGHSDYLHCIVARNSANQIITGSEDGTARIWDCKSGKCIQVIDPAENTKLKGFSCVSCIALDGSESWLVAVVGVYPFGIFLLLSAFQGLQLVLLCRMYYLMTIKFWLLEQNHFCVVLTLVGRFFHKYNVLLHQHSLSPYIRPGLQQLEVMEVL
ncbi:THO complex subunit 6 isoform X3 [Castanea sativa]|uniref:THO complex subunit 6 isoform X3 n=1 Tax=Castanea sativa TaxID=21020 RepID=UPI003F6534C4